MRRKLEDNLLRWKEMGEGRKPLLLNGARQVGKTWLLREFARRHYADSIHVSLDVNQRVAGYFAADISPQYVVRMLEAEYGRKIDPGGTLIILDEVQSSERALASLKYFCEEAPQYHVAAAGSLLGVAVNRERYSFPVGKVHSCTLFPLDFEEYLWARGEEFLVGAIREGFATGEALPEGLHLKAVGLYREYLVTGGMPACVKASCDGLSPLDIPALQNEITGDYLADMAKYASPGEAVKIRACYNSLPAQLGKENRKFQYKVVQRGGSATIFGAAIEWLSLAGVVLKCQKTEQGVQPVTTHLDLSSFKLYMGDVGLLCMKTGLRLSSVLSGEEHHFQGALAENYVAQQLAAGGHELFYWASGNTAEVDFIVQTQQGVTAVEVKSGVYTRSRSLNQFVKRYRPERAVRLSLKPFGTGGEVMAVPLYAAFCL
jgi:predicted AAA+ superfamily ATPase